MHDRTIQLDQLKIASPCPARWEEMTGDHRVRHCARCDLDVYNAAALTRDELYDLVRHKIDTNTRLCAQLRDRGDGTIITADCRVGLALIRRRARVTGARVAAVIGLSTLAAWLTPAAAWSAAAEETSDWTFLQSSYGSMRSIMIRAGIMKPPPPPLIFGRVCCRPGCNTTENPSANRHAARSSTGGRRSRRLSLSASPHQAAASPPRSTRQPM